MPVRARLVTAEEFAKIPDDDHRYELVEGRVIRMSPAGVRHAALAGQLYMILRQYVDEHGLGVVLIPGGFKLAANPDTVREPDVSFIRRDRIPSSGLPEGFWNGPPDLAVEVRSPSDRPSETREKIEDYLTRGVPLVWFLDPKKQTVTAYRRLSPPVVAGIDDTLDAGDIVPGFSCAVKKLFE